MPRRPVHLAGNTEELQAVKIRDRFSKAAGKAISETDAKRVLKIVKTNGFCKEAWRPTAGLVGSESQSRWPSAAGLLERYAPEHGGSLGYLRRELRRSPHF